MHSRIQTNVNGVSFVRLNALFGMKDENNVAEYSPQLTYSCPPLACLVCEFQYRIITKVSTPSARHSIELTQKQLQQLNDISNLCKKSDPANLLIQ